MPCWHICIIKGTSSDDHPLKYGLHQGSILGPKLFKVYTPSVWDICRHHGLQYQIYADNNDLYIAFKPPSRKDPDIFNRAIANIESCVLDIRSWMAINFLKLNELKTELLLIRSRYGALVLCSHIPHMFQLGTLASFLTVAWHWKHMLPVLWVQLSITSRTLAV